MNMSKRKKMRSRLGWREEIRGKLLQFPDPEQLLQEGEKIHQDNHQRRIPTPHPHPIVPPQLLPQGQKLHLLPLQAR